MNDADTAGGPWLSGRGPAAPAGGRRLPAAARRPASPLRRDEVTPWPAKPTLLGTRVKRLDGPDKVTGRAKYTYDINRPGMIYGRIVRSPHPARADRLDRFVGGAEGAGRQGRATTSRSRARR